MEPTCQYRHFVIGAIQVASEFLCVYIEGGRYGYYQVFRNPQRSYQRAY